MIKKLEESYRAHNSVKDSLPIPRPVRLTLPDGSRETDYAFIARIWESHGPFWAEHLEKEMGKAKASCHPCKEGVCLQCDTEREEQSVAGLQRGAEQKCDCTLFNDYGNCTASGGREAHMVACDTPLEYKHYAKGSGCPYVQEPKRNLPMSHNELLGKALIWWESQGKYWAHVIGEHCVELYLGSITGELVFKADCSSSDHGFNIAKVKAYKIEHPDKTPAYAELKKQLEFSEFQTGIAIDSLNLKIDQLRTLQSRTATGRRNKELADENVKLKKSFELMKLSNDSWETMYHGVLEEIKMEKAKGCNCEALDGYRG